MAIRPPVHQRVPIDLAKKLGPDGITRLLQLMVDAYHDLRKRERVRINSPEDSITEEWFVDIQQRWRMAQDISLTPIFQKQDDTKAKARGKRPSIDFCFRDRFESQSYFGAECKLLDEGSADYLRAYLDTEKGIGRFLDGRYGDSTGAGAMVGYVRVGNCDNVAGCLSMRFPNIKGKPTLKKSWPLRDFDQLYESKHIRNCAVVNFTCYHLLFGFNCTAV